jgi:hypothetical protein
MVLRARAGECQRLLAGFGGDFFLDRNAQERLAVLAFHGLTAKFLGHAENLSTL